MKASVTEKLLRSLLAKDEPQTIWDEIPPNLEWRIGKRDITGSVVGRVRGSGTRQPIRLRAGQSAKPASHMVGSSLRISPSAPASRPRPQ